MRILVVSDLFPPVAFGGYELECAALVARLRESHDVLVLTTDLDHERTIPERCVKRELTFMGGGRLRAVLRAPGAALHAAEVTRRVLDEFRPERIYVSNGASLPQTAIAIAATGGVPVICRFSERWFAETILRGDRFLRHLTGEERGLQRLWGRAPRVVNRHPSLRLPPDIRFRASISWASRSLRTAVGMPAPIEPVLERVIHPATARHEQFSALERIPSQQPTIAYVGRVTTAKGADVACRALAVLREGYGIDARLVIAGPCQPDMRRDLETLNRRLGIEGHVEMLGSLPADGVAHVLSSASVVVVPSVTWEAFPLVVLEAALARAPVVASRLGGIPEALAADEHVVLFEPGDARACAESLASVLGDPSTTAARVERAFARAGGFTLTEYLDKSEQLIAHAT